MGLWVAPAALLRHSMRAYILAVLAGLALVVSAFLPWVFVGDTPVGGVPDLAGLWVLGLGILAVVLASLSIVTRKNSRHPLLLVGLASFGILFLGERLMERSAAEQAWAASQAFAIVRGGRAPEAPRAAAGFGVYLGLAGAVVLVLFGLTIVVKRVARPYAEPEDDV